MTTNSKEWIQYLIAAIMVLSGIGLAYFSFFIKGDVTDGVLWYVGQAIAFAGGIFGVSIYFKTKLGETNTEINNMFKKIDKKIDEIK